MGGARKLSLALGAALCAGILAACGGGDDDSSSSTATGATSAESTVAGGGSSTQAGGGDGKQKGSGGDKGASGGGGSSGGSGGDGSSGGEGGGDGSAGGSGGDGSSGVGSGAGFDFSGEPTKHKHPTPTEGERAEAFRVPGGDNSIQEYGEEQGSEERAAAMVPIAALYRALFSGDWAPLCSTYLSSTNVKGIEALAQQSPQLKGKDCPELLSGLTRSVGQKGPDTPDGGVVSFRTEGDTGFAIYWGVDGKGYAIALKSEGGAWKLTSLAPTPLQVG